MSTPEEDATVKDDEKPITKGEIIAETRVAGKGIEAHGIMLWSTKTQDESVVDTSQGSSEEISQ